MTANRPEGHDRLGPPPRTLLRETPDTGWWTRDCNAPCHRCTRPPSSIFGAAPTIRARRVPCSRVAPGRGDRARIRLLRRAGSPGARWRRRRRRGDPRRREATSRERGRRSLTAPPRRSLWHRGVVSHIIGARPPSDASLLPLARNERAPRARALRAPRARRAPRPPRSTTERSTTERSAQSI